MADIWKRRGDYVAGRTAFHRQPSANAPAVLEVGDEFELRAPGYKPNNPWRIVEVHEKGIFAINVKESESGTNPDGWVTFCLKHFQIEHYREQRQFICSRFFDEDLKGFIADVENALEFVPVGDRIPYDIADGIVLEEKTDG